MYFIPAGRCPKDEDVSISTLPLPYIILCNYYSMLFRINGLLKTGAMRIEDKPLWYEVCTAFPPQYEPRFDRPATNNRIKGIFYEEDRIRA